MDNKIILSSSKLATLNKCSFVYWMTYVMGIRGKDNDGARRGSIVHIVFECLLKPRHKHHYDKIVNENNISASPVIVKLIDKISRRIGLGEVDNHGENNFDLINSMILVGLNCDFYCKDQQLEKAESEFYYEGPNYIIRGAIDKIAKKVNTYSIYDYKGSSEKYAGEEDEFNVQSLMYALWFYREKKAIPFFRFIFLRFKDDPYIDKQFTENQLKGFEDYLIYISDYLKDFNFKKATSNMAAAKGYPKDGSFSGALVCGYSKYPGHIKPKTGEPYFCCSFKHPKVFYYIKNSKGEVKYTTDNIDEVKLEEEDTFQEYNYSGCWWFYRDKWE